MRETYSTMIKNKQQFENAHVNYKVLQAFLHELASNPNRFLQEGMPPEALVGTKENVKHQLKNFEKEINHWEKIHTGWRKPFAWLWKISLLEYSAIFNFIMSFVCVLLGIMSAYYFFFGMANLNIIASEIHKKIARLDAKLASHNLKF